MLFKLNLLDLTLIRNLIKINNFKFKKKTKKKFYEISNTILFDTLTLTDWNKVYTRKLFLVIIVLIQK